MSDTFELHATPRADIGKGASRRLRHAGQLPAIIYGAGQTPESITFIHKDVKKATENEAFFSHILTININGKMHNAVVKAMQRHPYKQQIMHMDLLRINMNEVMTMNVPLHFVNADSAPGVKDGGTVSQLLTSVEIECLPSALPEYIEVDLAALALNQMLHLSDLKLPKGVKLTDLEGDEPDDLGVVNITVAKVKEESEEVVAASEVPAIEAKADKPEKS